MPWDHAATRVGIGDQPSVAVRAKNTRFVAFLSSKDQPPFCGHRGNLGECEQWMECARLQDRKGFPPIAWFAAYPGTSCSEGSTNVHDCQIERPSRSCDPEEKAEDAANGHDPGACARPNGFALADLVGENGGPEGVRRICTLPSSYDPSRRRGAPVFNYNVYDRTEDGGFKNRFPRRGLPRAAPGATPTCKSWDFRRGSATLLP